MNTTISIKNISIFSSSIQIKKGGEVLKQYSFIEHYDNQAGENGHNGRLGSGDGGNDNTYWDWYNQKIKEQQKAEEERKAREEAERITQERDRKNQEDVNNAVEVASTVNDLLSGVLGNMKDAHVRSVGSVTPGFFGHFLMLIKFFQQKQIMKKVKQLREL